MAGADDDEGGTDQEQDDFEQPAAFPEETTQSFELGTECLDGRGELGAQTGTGDGMWAIFHIAANEFPLVPKFTTALALLAE